MTPKKRYKTVLCVPESHADELRKAIGEAGAGVTRFIPGPGSNLTTSELGKMKGTVCEEDKSKPVLRGIKDVYLIEVFK